MTEIISVRFKEGGKAYYFNPNGLNISVGEKVIIETSRGVEFGECVEGNRLIDEMELVSPLRPVVRKASQQDLAAVEENRAREKRAFTICEEKIAEHGLDMKLVDVEYNFDGSKILFFFTSEGRVDFRNLVRDLASIFHTRIELRQIGVRDEAKMLGGLGICGRPFCCTTYMDDFHPVSIKMAKTQNLSLNPTKISGTCGRLMCCLKYEQEAYEDVLSRTPKQDSLVETPEGVGEIISVQLLREKVKVKLDDDPDNPQVFPISEIRVIRNGKGKRPEGYELPDPEVLAARQAERQAARLRNTLLTPAAPATPAPEAKPKAEGETSSGGERRRRNRHRKKSSGEAKLAPAQQPQPQKQGQKSQKQAKPQAQGQKPQAEGAPEQKAKPRRKRPRRKKPQGEKTE
ncbi:MAG: stage 0 sporulation family protein [Oscillospiraceae bacterium]|nr:stage 0 sporulation family protein [Oscillospiraceae bacterium]